MFERSSGILLHFTSLPGRYGIGDLGENARKFVDFLVETDQSLWQFMPLGPTGYGDSPYQCFSAFAGNPLIISPDVLVEEGFLSKEAVEEVPDFPVDSVDYGPVINYKKELLYRAYQESWDNFTAAQKRDLAKFQKRNANWLPDFALFMALKEHHGGAVWNTWEKSITRHKPKAVATWRKELEDQVNFQIFQQFQFDRQWRALRQYAHSNGIKLVGDIPIFAAYDSADVWSNPDSFLLDKDGLPLDVAGVPPDYFSATGQLWGNPLYNWEALEKRGFDWWIQRFHKTFELVDIVRIDHFRGMAGFWAVPYGDETAENGEWRKGPGEALFEVVSKEFGDAPIIAEDLGFITPDVHALRKKYGYPGMKIVQFAFADDGTDPFLPHNHERNSVVYTGSHDNDTAKGWYEKAPDKEKHLARLFTNSDGHDFSWDLIRLTFSSVANTALAPLQDVLALGSEGRMNFPGKPAGNWQWRFRWEMIDDFMMERLKLITQIYARDKASVEKTAKMATANLVEGYDFL